MRRLGLRKRTIALGAGAVIVLAGAAVLRFAVVPAVHQVPDDLDATARYAGTASMLNAAALKSGDTKNAFVKGIPVTASQRVHVTGTDGGTAVVSEVLTVRAPDGKKLRNAQHRYAIDRVNLDAAKPPQGSKAEEHQGLSVGFPLTPKKTSYPFWDAATQATAPATYRKTVTAEGREAYVYHFQQMGKVADRATLAALPKALPKAQLKGLAAGQPKGKRDRLSAALGRLPDPVPVTYTSTADTTFTIDRETGTPLRAAKSQTVTANIAGGTPLAQVMDLRLNSTPASVKERAGDAADAARLLSLAKTVIPLSLLGLAVLLAVAAAWTARRRNA
ncbi:porin PorA family protein [Streptomyces boninensis]|uniref:porin PorA family protein n=1 Tax=Streptomyces boninensis TaxID=2039455 RepID=UPI003B20FFF1